VRAFLTIAGSQRFVAAVVIVGVLLVGLSWITANAAADRMARPPADLDSPEGVVYRWLQHQRNGEIEEAFALWDEAATEAASLETYLASGVGSFVPSGERERFLIEPRVRLPDIAQVKVVTARYTSLLPFSAPLPRQRSTVFTLTGGRGDWRIAGVDNWPFFNRPPPRT
jgi:hypothetical protein